MSRLEVGRLKRGVGGAGEAVEFTPLLNEQLHAMGDAIGISSQLG